jgi:hypothetical protein
LKDAKALGAAAPLPGNPVQLRDLRALVEVAELERQLAALGLGGDTPFLDAATRSRAAIMGLRRATLILEIAADSLALYSVAVRGGRQPPVVALRDGHCAGCNLRVPPLLDYRLRQVPKTAACPHCRRVLYDPAWLSAPAGATAP